jgi:hypothetical protein
VPRRDPLTQADIAGRSRLTGFPKIADPIPGKPVRRTGVLADTSVRAATEWDFMAAVGDVARNWNFDPAIDILNIRHIEKRARCTDELSLICHHDLLVRKAEEQETPGRRARAFQLAPQWRNARMREWREMGDPNKKRAEQALRRWQKLPWLPQSLEQEAVRELGHIPTSRNDFALLRKRTMRSVRRGRHKSWALRSTIHAIQACAATWNKKLIWDKNRRAPPERLLEFLVEVLRAARINHPNPETNRSKFIALMHRPKKQCPAGASGTEKQAERPPEPSELERRLAKVFL